MKKAFSRSIFGKFIIALMVILMLGSLQPTRVEASIGGAIAEPVCDLLVGLCDGIVYIVHHVIYPEQNNSLIRFNTSKGILAKIIGAIAAVAIAAAIVAISATGVDAAVIAGIWLLLVSGTLGTAIVLGVAGGVLLGGVYYDKSSLPDEIVLPLYTVSPEEIFKGEIGLFDVNFFSQEVNEKSVDQKLQQSLAWSSYARGIEDRATEKDSGVTAVDGKKEDYGFDETKCNTTRKGNKQIKYWTNGGKTYFQVVSGTGEKKEGGAVDSPAGDARAVSNMNNYTKIYAVDTEKASLEVKDTNKSIAQELKPTIATWYRILRNIALVAMLSILVYIGIRIVISTTAENKAKYKQFLVDWAVGLCLLFIMHYGMAFLNLFINKLTYALSDITTNGYLTMLEWDADKYEDKLEESGVTIAKVTEDTMGTSGADVEILQKDDNEYLMWQTNLMGYIRMNANYAKNEDEGYLGSTVLFIMMVIFLFLFIWMYLKRVMYMAFLTLIAPFVAVTYPLDKIKDGKAQGFDYWFKEYFYNILLQPLHLLIYTVLVGGALNLVTENVIYAIAALAFLLPAEKILKQMFGFKGETSSGLAQFAGHAMGYNALQKAFGRIGPGKGSSSGGGAGSSDSGGGAGSSDSGGDNSGKNNKIKWASLPGANGNPPGGPGRNQRRNGGRIRQMGRRMANANGKFFGALARNAGSTMKRKLKNRAKTASPGRNQRRNGGRIRQMGRRMANANGKFFGALARNAGSTMKRKLKNRAKTASPGRWLGRYLGAGALGITALAMGAATGDPGKALAFTAGGAALGWKSGEGLARKGEDLLGIKNGIEMAEDSIRTPEEREMIKAKEAVNSEQYMNSFNKFESDDRQRLKTKSSNSDSRLNELMAQKGITNADEQLAIARTMEDQGALDGSLSDDQLKNIIEEKKAEKQISDSIGGEQINNLSASRQKDLTEDIAFHLDQNKFNEEEARKDRIRDEKDMIKSNESLGRAEKQAQLNELKTREDAIFEERKARAQEVLDKVDNYSLHREDVKKRKSYNTNHRDRIRNYI